MTLPAVSILGVGAVTPIGRDLASITLRLASSNTSLSPDALSPTFDASAGGTVEDTGANHSQSNGSAAGLAFHVDDAQLADPALGKRLRRADRFTRMAVIAASDAWTQAQSANAKVPMERIGLIVSSGFGPHGRGFKFLDGILDCGDTAALPTDFSHSVHGAPAAYITEILGLRGPSLSVTDFISGFEQTVQLAQCWLAEGTCDRVLVGAVEELGEVLLHCGGRMLSGEQRIVPSEGAVFFMLGPIDSPYAVARLTVADQPKGIDLLLLDQPTIGLPTPDVSAIDAGVTWSFSPNFGHNPSSAAFQLLAGLLAMRPPLAVDNAATFRPSCDPSAATLLLTKNSPSDKRPAYDP